MKQKSPLTHLIIILLSCLNSFSATITVGGSGNWSSTTANAPWPGGVLPAPGDNIVISGGRTLTVDGNYSITNVTIGSAAGTTNSLLVNSGFTLTVTNTITITPPNAGTNNNILSVGAGYVLCSGLFSSDSNNDTRDCNITISTGTLNVNGNATLGTTALRNALTFSANGLFQVSGTFTGGGTFTPSTGTVEYDGGAQTLHTTFTTFNNLSLSNTGIKAAAATFTVGGNLLISGTSQLDLTATPRNLTLKGNWNVTSTSADPFVERSGRVTLNGNAGIQTISTVLAGGETFNKLTIANTSASNPAIIFSNKITISDDYDHTTGFADLQGNSMICSGANSGAQAFALNGGGLISSVSGSSVSISQGSNVLDVDYSGFQIGDHSIGITTNMTSDNSTWINSNFYGTTNFVKTGATSQTFGGGNAFYGACSFSTSPVAARWRMGDDGAGTSGSDIYNNATFTHDGSSNLRVCTNNKNNHFYGTTIFNSTTTGGVYITSASGTNGNYDATFHGPVIVNVSETGTVYFADATTNFSNTVTFEGTIQVNSLATSTGDIYFGRNAASTIILTNTAQFIAGSVLGLTSIRLINLTQNGSLVQTISGSSNSKLFCGTSTVPCTFNGQAIFSCDTIDVQKTTFNESVTFTGNSQHTLFSNTFNGSTNSFTKNGTSNNSTTGANTFIAGSSSVFTNNGTGYWRLANTNADDYNGDVTFVQKGTGLLQPAYNTNCTFSGDISTIGTTAALDFGTGASGRVTIDGSSSQNLNGSSSFKPIIRRLTMSTTGTGALILNVPIDILVSITMTNGVLTSSSTNSLTLLSHTTTSTIGNSNSYINGPLHYNVLSTAVQTLNFPVGKGTKWRPVILAERNSVTTSITYKAEVVNTSARSLGYSFATPATIDTVSDFNYWDIDRTLTSTGGALPTQSLTGTQVVTLYYTATDGVNDPTNLRIAKNTSTASTTWIDIGGTGSSAGAGFITSTSTPSVFTSYSRFTLADKIGGKNPLPIELISFAATKNNKLVDVKWETASESNNDYYLVERSKDGINFETFSNVDAAGNSLSKLNYSTIDDNPFNGISYYRLKQVDFNGTFTYSKIASVDFNSTRNFSFDIYPNPNKGTNFNIAFEGLKNQEVVIVVYDVTGKESFSKVLITNENESSVFVIDPTNTLSSGVYVITATSKQDIYRKKLIIE